MKRIGCKLRASRITGDRTLDMALLHATARTGGLSLRRIADGDGGDRDGGGGGARDLLAALARAPAGAPVTVLIHGFRYCPGARRADPHALLFAADGPGTGADWPGGLGFSPRGRRDGLCIGFGWDARPRHGRALVARGRNGFAEAYDRAAEAGALLGELIAAVAAARLDLRVDLFAHSLGARVALTALPAPGVGRVVLLGPAEDAAVAASALPPPRRDGPEVCCILARHNDVFDALFEAVAPRRDGARPTALGRRGLGARRDDWIDLRIDAEATERWLAARGAPLGPGPARACHRGFYARPGVMELYRAILRDRDRWSIASMRAAGAPEEHGPRRSLPPGRPDMDAGRGDDLAPAGA